MRRITTAKGLPPAVGPYSLAVITDDTVYTSGQIGLDAEGKLVEGGVETEARQVMDNLRRVLDAAGPGFGDVIKSTIYLTNVSDFAVVNAIYASYFDNEYPARETVGVAALPLGARVEISMVAVMASSSDT